MIRKSNVHFIHQNYELRLSIIRLCDFLSPAIKFSMCEQRNEREKEDKEEEEEEWLNIKIMIRRKTKRIEKLEEGEGVRERYLKKLWWQ